MPKFGIHYIIKEKLIKDLLSDTSNSDNKIIGDIMTKERVAANLGCIGPDLLFWAPDFDIVKQLEKFVRTYSAFKVYYDEAAEFVEMIKKNIDNGIDAVQDELENLPTVGPVFKIIDDYHELKDAIKEQFAFLTDAIKAEIGQAIFLKSQGLDSDEASEKYTMGRSLFHSLFQNNQQMGREEMEWYWFEMLHYRNTGDFVKQLIANAEQSGDDKLKAYAYGYASHYAADLVGHPYVNTISGSPFRINLQRHVVIENFMDQYQWYKEYTNSIRNNLYSSLGFKENPTLSPKLAELISTTIQEVYCNVIHPLRQPRNLQNRAINTATDGFLSPEDINTAYIYQRLMLEHLGGMEEVLKPVAPPGAEARLAAMASAGELGIPAPPPLPSPIGMPTNNENLFDELDAWTFAANNFINWAVDAAKTVVDKITAALDAVANVNVAEIPQGALTLIGDLAYAAENYLYNAYRQIHQVLALSGLAYPEPDDVNIDTDPLAAALITTRNINYKEFPILRTPGQPNLDTRSYISVMEHGTNRDIIGKDTEMPNTIASYYPQEDDKTPAIFIDGISLDIQLLKKYAGAISPEETCKIQRQNKKSFGSAVNVTKYILNNRHNRGLHKTIFCNWNLDGDRGYGYKCWDGIPFTTLKGEIDGAIDKNESFEEVIQQGNKCWTTVSEVDFLTSAYKAERYDKVDNKKLTDTILAAMNICEGNIPEIFWKRDRINNTSVGEWLTLVPPRLIPGVSTIKNTIFFCNGMNTTPSSGIRSTISLQKSLNEAIRLANRNERFEVKLLHNYTYSQYGGIAKLADICQSVVIDYLNAILNTEKFNKPEPLMDIANPTGVAIVALLHACKEKKSAIILSGHSQGCMIMTSAILHFASISQANKDYLKGHVKLFYMEGEVLVKTRILLRSLVKQFLVYMMNASDAGGTDILCEISAGVAPLIPVQILGGGTSTRELLYTDTGNITRLRRLITNPDLLNVEYYNDLIQSSLANTDDITAYINAYAEARVQYLEEMDMESHFMPAQLPIILKDIVNNRFRTDQGSIANPSAALSGNISVNDTSVNVRDFFIT